MLVFEDYKANWPKTFDRINEIVEDEKLRYTYLNDKEKRLIIGNLIAEDKDIDLSPQDLRDWMQMLIENPDKDRAQTLCDKIYQANKKLIDGMFNAALEYLEEKKIIHMQYDTDFKVSFA